ncbi:hypothetical protein D3C78_1546650 [compost metagenome]
MNSSKRSVTFGFSSLRRASGETSNGYWVMKCGCSSLCSTSSSKIITCSLPRPSKPRTLAPAFLAIARALSMSFRSSAVNSGLYLRIESNTDRRTNGSPKWNTLSPYGTSVLPRTSCASSRNSSSVRSMLSS